MAQVQPDEMHLTFVGAEGQKLYTYTRQRRRNHDARPLASAGGRPAGLEGGGSAKRMNTKNVRLAACMKRCTPLHPGTLVLPYRGTSLISTPPPLGPYSSPMLRDLW